MSTVAILHAVLAPRNRRQLWLNRPNLRRVDRFVAVSEAMGKIARETFGVGAAFRVIPNGVEDHGVPVRTRDERRAGTRSVIGSVGRLSVEKGYDQLVRALPELPGVKCVLIGDGPERAALELLAAELGVGEQLELLGWVDDPRPRLADFDVFVQPSRSEAAGLAVIEAMLAGRPVVASRVGGLPEVVVEGQTGLLGFGRRPSAAC